MKSIHPTSSSSNWLARAGSGILAAGACLFLMATFASQVQAQVTYKPILAGSDFSTLATNGTATILYSLQGSPAESPYGSSFSITFSLSPMDGTGTHLSFGNLTTSAGAATTQNFNAALLLRIRLDHSTLQESDFIQVANTQNAQQQAFDGEITPKMSYTYTTGALADAPNWSLISGTIGALHNSGGGTAEPGTYETFYELRDANGNFIPNFSSTGFGTTTTVNPYFTYAGPNVAQALVGAQSNANGFQTQISFQSLTFAPVPEPGGAFLMATAGFWFIFRRRRLR